MRNAKLDLIESVRRLLYFHTTNTTSESSLVHDIRNLLSGELTETTGPVEPDTSHHAPSPTTPWTTKTVTRTYEVPPLDKNADAAPADCGCDKYDEPLTKRERFAMEFAKAIMAGRSTSTIDILAKDEGGAQAGACSAAVNLADRLIAELAKGRK